MNPAAAILCAAAIVGGSINAALADEKRTEPKNAKLPRCEKCAKAKMEIRTGSHLAVRVRENSRIGDGPSPSVILSREDIQRAGYSTLVGTLAGTGFRR